MVQGLPVVTRKIRIKFIKQGALKFISHLDLCRTMKTALIRAGIPIYYTEGFNPHPKMVFALPLSIGASSDCEYMDLKLVAEMSDAEVKERLAAALPVELAPIAVYEPQVKFAEIGWARYRMTFFGDYGVGSAAKLTEMLTSPMIVMKHTKNGERETDIQGGIGRFEIVELEGAAVLDIMLKADSANYTNPELIVQAMKEKPEDYRIERMGVYLADGITLFV
ncbi:MAG: DUF2344 domain-containing protein [Clostridia bacterium]|nr:DUF2344 domain-containing protein [Clostridia bacterium]MBQ4575306.1 DUF2344 domain-containing protein [Clostridia bacterium]